MSAETRQASNPDTHPDHDASGTVCKTVLPGPSPNGVRESGGQFAKGNPGGPGNPYARQVAELRKRMLAKVTSDDVDALIRAMIDKGKEGDVQAAKLALAYVLGMPTPAPDPDRQDLEEWGRLKEEAAIFPELPLVMNSVAPPLAIGVGRELRAISTEKMADTLVGMLKNPSPSDADIPDLVVPRKRKANGKNGGKGTSVADAPGSPFDIPGSPHGDAAHVSLVNMLSGGNGSPSANGESDPHPAEAMRPRSEEEAEWLRILAERFPRR